MRKGTLDVVLSLHSKHECSSASDRRIDTVAAVVLDDPSQGELVTQEGTLSTSALVSICRSRISSITHSTSEQADFPRRLNYLQADHLADCHCFHRLTYFRNTLGGKRDLDVLSVGAQYR